MILIILCFHLVAAVTRHRYLPLLTNNSYFACSDCKFGPVKLTHNFKIFDEPIQQLYIQADGIVHKENCTHPYLCDTRISILNFNSRNLSCHIYQNEIRSKFKLVWLDDLIRNYKGFSNFTSSWAYSIFWVRVGDKNEQCQHTNSYQMIFVTDNNSHFILYNYVNLNFIPSTKLNTEIKTKSKRIEINFNLNHLYYSSNINVPGIWVYNVDNQKMDTKSINFNQVKISSFKQTIKTYIQESYNNKKPIPIMLSESNINYKKDQVFISIILSLIANFII